MSLVILCWICYNANVFLSLDTILQIFLQALNGGEDHSRPLTFLDLLTMLVLILPSMELTFIAARVHSWLRLTTMTPSSFSTL